LRFIPGFGAGFVRGLAADLAPILGARPGFGAGFGAGFVRGLAADLALILGARPAI